MAFSDHLHAKDWTFATTSRSAQRRNQLALYILIASLGMFFTAALLGYLMIRLRGNEQLPLNLPPVLWLSTVFAIVGSTFLWRSLRSVQRERQARFRRQVLIAFLCGVCFCVSQTIGLSSLLGDHFDALKERSQAAAAPKTEPPAVRKPVIPRLGPIPQIDGQWPEEPAMTPAAPKPVIQPIKRLEGLLFVLVLLHIVHFVAGMISLSVVTFRAWKGRYDHEYHNGVRLCAIYWRFLDVVWVVLFGAFLLTA